MCIYIYIYIYYYYYICKQYVRLYQLLNNSTSNYYIIFCIINLQLYNKEGEGGRLGALGGEGIFLFGIELCNLFNLFHFTPKNRICNVYNIHIHVFFFF